MIHLTELELEHSLPNVALICASGVSLRLSNVGTEEPILDDQRYCPSEEVEKAKDRSFLQPHNSLDILLQGSWDFDLVSGKTEAGEDEECFVLLSLCTANIEKLPRPSLLVQKHGTAHIMGVCRRKPVRELLAAMVVLLP